MRNCPFAPRFITAIACLFYLVQPGPASAEKIPKAVDEYIGKTLPRLEERRGHNDRDWDQLIAYAIRYKDSRILNKMLDVPATQGMPEINQRMDLFQIFKAQPDFFLKTGYQHYSSNVDCLVLRLVPVSQQFPFARVEKILSKLSATGNEVARRTLTRARDYHARMKTSPPKLNIARCPIKMKS